LILTLAVKQAHVLILGRLTGVLRHGAKLIEVEALAGHDLIEQGRLVSMFGDSRFEDPQQLKKFGGELARPSRGVISSNGEDFLPPGSFIR